MITTETFDLIQGKLHETAADPYDIRDLNFDDSRFLIDGTFSNPTLRKFGKVCFKLSYPGYEDTKLPPDAEWYNALYTNKMPSAELVDERSRKLSVFVLRNKPVDMGSFVYMRAVVTERTEADVALLEETPLVVGWGRPSGILAAESPLLYEEESRFAWQKVVTEVLDELAEV